MPYLQSPFLDGCYGQSDSAVYAGTLRVVISEVTIGNNLLHVTKLVGWHTLVSDLEGRSFLRSLISGTLFTGLAVHATVNLWNHRNGLEANEWQCYELQIVFVQSVNQTGRTLVVLHHWDTTEVVAVETNATNWELVWTYRTAHISVWSNFVVATHNGVVTTVLGLNNRLNEAPD